MKQKKEKNTDIHQHLRMISRLNIALATFGLVVVVFLFIWMKWFPPVQEAFEPMIPDTSNSLEKSVVPTVDTKDQQKEYRTAINDLLDGFAFDSPSEAEALSSQVLAMKTAPEYRSLHLQLAIALDEVQQNKTDEAQERIASLQEEYSWFLPSFSK